MKFKPSYSEVKIDYKFAKCLSVYTIALNGFDIVGNTDNEK